MGLRVTSMNHRREYNLPYSFWRKKTPTTERRAAQLYFHILTRNESHIESDVTQALSMRFHPGINCLTPLVIYSPDAIPSSSTLRYLGCATRARCLPPDPQHRRQLCCVCRSHSNCAQLPAKANRPRSLAPPWPLIKWKQRTKQRAGREKRGEERDQIPWLAIPKNLPPKAAQGSLRCGGLLPSERGWWDGSSRLWRRPADTGWQGKNNSRHCR